MEFKKELIIGGVITAGLLLMAVIYTFNYKSQFVSQNVTELAATEMPTANSKTTNESKITAAQVAKHNKATDCWIVINNKVLSVSAYLNLHPGGPGTITPYCGKDATNAFNAIEGGRGHSQKAKNMLVNFLVGILGKTISPEESAKLSMVTIAN